MMGSRVKSTSKSGLITESIRSRGLVIIEILAMS